LVLCTQLLKNCVTTPRLNKEKPAIVMGETLTWCIRRTQNEDVL
jgi:hypothetical protein